MLAYILAILVGVSSTGLYLWAFFFPEIHRKQDFIWSGVGLFYALFLWLYARQVTGGILVGQTASVALLGWFGWETFQLRRQLVSVDRSNTVTSNPTKRQNQREVNRAAPTVAKPTTKAPLPSPPPTSSAPIPAPTPVATTPTNPSVSSTPLAQLKVPPATSTAKVTPAEPTILVDSRSIEVPPPTSSTKSSPTTASPQPSQSIDPLSVNVSTSEPIPAPAVNLSAEKEEAWIKLEVKPAPAKPLGTPAPPPTAANTAPAQSPAPVPEVITKNISTEPTETTTELESENWA
jgi:Ycf66 protein N-terminus